MSQAAATWVAWTIEADVPSADADALQALADEMAADFLATEPGTTHFEWSRTADSRRLVLHERYSDSGAALRHIERFGAAYAARFTALVEPKRVVVYGHPSGELLQALQGFGPEVLLTFAGFSR